MSSGMPNCHPAGMQVSDNHGFYVIATESIERSGIKCARTTKIRTVIEAYFGVFISRVNRKENC